MFNLFTAYITIGISGNFLAVNKKMSQEKNKNKKFRHI